MAEKWSDLKFWGVGEWDVIKEKLSDLRKSGTPVCPARSDLFRCMHLTPLAETTVCIVGQDPYPDPTMATGVAFSIPKDKKMNQFPETLKNIFTEYMTDLHYPYPDTGNLEHWSAQGVLLWNALPSCTAFHSLSHNWPEYHLLTQEVVETLSEKGIVFAFVGGVAREFAKFVKPEWNEVIEVAHPSPRAGAKARNPFNGSRFFSTINAKLKVQGYPSIDWRLT